MTLDAFFEGFEDARPLYDAVVVAVAEIGAAAVRVSKSQIAFRRRTAFAWVWIPDRYLRGHHAPLVLTVALRRWDSDARWKQIVEPASGRFTHHLELRAVADVDDFVKDRLREAWADAG